MQPTQTETPPLHTAIQDRLLGILTALDYQQSDIVEQITATDVAFRPCTSAKKKKRSYLLIQYNYRKEQAL